MSIIYTHVVTIPGETDIKATIRYEYQPEIPGDIYNPPTPPGIAVNSIDFYANNTKLDLSGDFEIGLRLDSDLFEDIIQKHRECNYGI